MQLVMAATHSLERESQGRHHEKSPDAAHHKGHSLAGEPRAGIVSRIQIKLKLTTKATHFLERIGVIRIQMYLTMTATHFLKNQGQES